MQTVEATIDEHGTVRLREAVALTVPRRALVTILEEAPPPLPRETPLLHQPLPPIIPAQTSTEEFIRRMREVGRVVDPSVPPLSDEATRRESIYDHEGL